MASPRIAREDRRLSAALALAGPANRAAEWLTIGPAAGRLGVSRQTVHCLVEPGRLTGRRLATWTDVSLADVARLAEASMRPWPDSQPVTNAIPRGACP